MDSYARTKPSIPNVLLPFWAVLVEDLRLVLGHWALWTWIVLGGLQGTLWLVQLPEREAESDPALPGARTMYSAGEERVAYYQQPSYAQPSRQPGVQPGIQPAPAAGNRGGAWPGRSPATSTSAAPPGYNGGQAAPSYAPGYGQPSSSTGYPVQYQPVPQAAYAPGASPPQPLYPGQAQPAYRTTSSPGQSPPQTSSSHYQMQPAPVAQPGVVLRATPMTSTSAKLDGRGTGFANERPTAAHFLAPLIRFHLLFWVTLVVALAASAIPTEAAIALEAILSRGISRSSYLLAKQCSRAIAGVFAFLLIATPMVVVASLRLENDLTLAGAVRTLGYSALMIFLVSVTATATSVFSRTPLVAVAVAWMFVYGLGLSVAMLDVALVSPIRWTGSLVHLFQGTVLPDVTHFLWALAGLAAATTLVAMIHYGHRDL